LLPARFTTGRKAITSLYATRQNLRLELDNFADAVVEIAQNAKAEL
jgi:hypothetical protein